MNRCIFFFFKQMKFASECEKFVPGCSQILENSRLKREKINLNIFKTENMSRQNPRTRREASRARKRQKTREELKQITFPKDNPGFVYTKISEEDVNKCQLTKDLRELKSSEAIMTLLKGADPAGPMDPSSIPPYKPCEDLEERYGPIEYHPIYGAISPEAIWAKRKSDEYN